MKFLCETDSNGVCFTVHWSWIQTISRLPCPYSNVHIMNSLSRREEETLLKTTKTYALRECDDVVKGRFSWHYDTSD